MGIIMPEFKLTISDPKTGKTYSNNIDTDIFKSTKIGDLIKGDNINLQGYELQITGGSDKQGFPMRATFPSTIRKKLLLTKGPCIKIKRKGQRIRKSVRGNQISLAISQINLKITKQGNKPIDELFGKKESAEVKAEQK